jgi:hypothetical protein
MNDHAPHTVSLTVDLPALKQAMRDKQWAEGKEIMKRMMADLHKLYLFVEQQAAK